MKIHSDSFDWSKLESPTLKRQNLPGPTEEELEQKSEKEKKKMEIESQIAPNAKKSFKKTKSWSVARGGTSSEKDADKIPWILSDEKSTLVGNRQEAPSSTYALFVFAQDGFKVIPVSRRYKFTPKLNRQVLTTEEAEEKIGNFAHKPGERWMMRRSKENGTLTKDPSSQEGPVKKKKGKKKAELEELDYEEEFADDEDIDFGIEDKDEAREASHRQYGRAGKHALLGEEDSDFEDEEKKVTRLEKALTKALTKFEKNDMYDGLFEEDNPYLSEADEDSQMSVVKQEGNKLGLSDFVVKKRPTDLAMGEAEAALQKLKSSFSGEMVIKQESSESTKNTLSSDEGSMKKRRKLDTLPPPPTASQVIARELEKHKKTARSKKTPGTPSSQSGLAYSPTNSPMNSPSPTPSSEEGLLSDEDVIKLLKSSNQSFTVKEIVTHFKSNLLQNRKNKDQIREIMRRVLNHDKTTGKVCLKKEFM